MSESYDIEDVPARRPVTRSLVQSGLIFFISPTSSWPIPAKKTKPKKVKFVEPQPSDSVGHNTSVTTDEGIDLSFSSPSGSASINIPASIARPHHGLGQTWTFWFSGNNKPDSWSQDLVSVANMRTVEEFWTVYSQVCVKVRRLVYRCSTGVIPRSSPAVSCRPASPTPSSGPAWPPTGRIPPTGPGAAGSSASTPGRGRTCWTSGGWRFSSPPWGARWAASSQVDWGGPCLAIIYYKNYISLSFN